MEQRNKRTLIAQIFPILLVIGISILTLYRFTYKNELKVKENNSTYLREISRQKTQQVNQIFEDDLSTIQSLAYLYGETMNDNQVDLVKLKEIENSTGFDYIRFVDQDGMNHATDGSVKDCSDREYFINGMSGEYGLASVAKSRVNGETMIGFYAPVHHEEKIVGVLVGFLSKHRMSKELTSYFYDYTGVTLVCDPNRIVVASSNEQAVGEKASKIYNGRDKMSKEKFEEARQKMRQEDGKIDEVYFQGDNGETVAYICHLNYEGWRLIHSFPSAVNKELTDNYNQYGIQMMIVLAGTFGIYICWLVVTFVQDMRRSTRKMKENSYQQMQMIQVLSENYGNVLCLDLRDETFEVYRMEERYGEYLKQIKGTYSDIIYGYIEEFVVEEDKERLHECLNIDRLKENLCKQPSILVNYRKYNEKEGEDTIFYCVKCARIGEADSFQKIIFGFANIDRETREEVEHKQLLVDALSRAEKANQAKTIFLSNMSHDIRTPLNAINGFSNIAVTHLDDMECVKDSLDKILSSGEHLLGLINDVLDMSRIESGKVTLEETKTHLSELIHNIVSIIQPQVTAKQLEFRVDTYDIKDEVVYIDALKMQRILINILGNAVKFTPEGRKITMEIRQLPDVTPSGFAAYEFRVCDTGMGMEQEFLEHIFEPFERERTSTQSKIEGTGLGMAITKSIVDMMGGTIEVKSKKGEGSEFSIRLELRIGEELGSLEETEKVFAEEQKEEAVQKVDITGKRILLVEDVFLNQQLAMIILKERGATVDLAKDGLEAVNRMKEVQEGFYDLIFMDIMMPVMDGYEAARTIRALEREDVKTLPIIAMTANVYEDDKRKVLENGMDAHVSKPFKMENLEKVLGKYLA